MSFENTQLFLSGKVRHKLQGDGSAIALKEYLEYYHMGAVFPDILFCSKDDNFSQVAQKLRIVFV